MGLTLWQDVTNKKHKSTAYKQEADPSQPMVDTYNYPLIAVETLQLIVGHNVQPPEEDTYDCWLFGIRTSKNNR